MPIILVCLATLPFNAAALPLKALGWGLEILNKITAEVSALPNSLLTVPDMPLWGFLLIICGAYWLCAWQKKWRLWGLAPIAVGLLSLLTAQNPVALVAPNGIGFAVRNKAQNMVLVPLATDSWLKKVWQERWQVRTLHK
jgi:competence protein ComEC